jgi:hypothetical protein
VGIGEAHQKIASTLFGFVELTGMDEVDNCIGSRGELILVVVEVRIVGPSGRRAWIVSDGLTPRRRFRTTAATP